eukprot:COSAG05_NODE_962_length_6414_cov_4.358353_7_plen_65_part_00
MDSNFGPEILEKLRAFMAAPIRHEPIINVDSDTESEGTPSDSDSDYEDSDSDDDTVRRLTVALC